MDKERETDKQDRETYLAMSEEERETNRTGILIPLRARIKKHTNRHWLSIEEQRGITGVLIILWVRIKRQANWTGILVWLQVKIERQTNRAWILN